MTGVPPIEPMPPSQPPPPTGSPPSPAAHLASFAVGLALALAAELSVGLLLYAADGFVRALTTILATGLAALGLGLATAPGPGPGLDVALRRRWLLAVVAFTAAAVVALGWSLEAGPAEGGWRRGFGLALLTVLPLYAGGTVLGGLASKHPPRAVGAPAVLGAALGVVLQGGVLLTRVEPVSVYLLGVVLVSGAALLGTARDEGDAVAPRRLT